MNPVDITNIVAGRVRFVRQWCEKHGKSQDGLSMNDILAIRAEPGWKTPADAIVLALHTDNRRPNSKAKGK